MKNLFNEIIQTRIAVVIIHGLDRYAKISPVGSNPDQTEQIYETGIDK